MKKLLALAAMLFIAMSVGTGVARADGGETGADASHTQPFWYHSGYRP